jgi:hypothetical protein
MNNIYMVQFAAYPIQTVRSTESLTCDPSRKLFERKNSQIEEKVEMDELLTKVCPNSKVDEGGGVLGFKFRTISS